MEELPTRGLKRSGDDLDDSSRTLSPEEACWADQVAQLGPPYYDNNTGKVLDEEKVKAAMKKEIESIQSFGTLVEPTTEQLEKLRCIGTRWVLVVKPLPDAPDNVKARLVVQDVNYGNSPMDTFAATPTTMGLKLVIVKGIDQHWMLGTIDLSTAFLHAPLEPEEQIIVRMPKMGWCLPLQNYLCTRALYGIRTSPRVYQEEFARRVSKHGIVRLKSDPQLFVDPFDGSLMSVHVDDIMYTTPNPERLQQILEAEFKLKKGPIISPT